MSTYVDDPQGVLKSDRETLKANGHWGSMWTWECKHCGLSCPVSFVTEKEARKDYRGHRKYECEELNEE